jgi:hypothetical protein
MPSLSPRRRICSPEQSLSLVQKIQVPPPIQYTHYRLPLRLSPPQHQRHLNRLRWRRWEVGQRRKRWHFLNGKRLLPYHVLRPLLIKLCHCCRRRRGKPRLRGAIGDGMRDVQAFRIRRVAIKAVGLALRHRGSAQTPISPVLPRLRCHRHRLPPFVDPPTAAPSLDILGRS